MHSSRVIINQNVLCCSIRIDEGALVVISIVKKVSNVVGPVPQVLLRNLHEAHDRAVDRGSYQMKLLKLTQIDRLLYLRWHQIMVLRLLLEGRRLRHGLARIVLIRLSLRQVRLLGNHGHRHWPVLHGSLWFGLDRLLSGARIPRSLLSGS